MSSSLDPAFQRDTFPSELGPEYLGFDSMTWYVGNAKQAASYYVTRWGFKVVAYMGPENGTKEIVGYVVNNGEIYFVFLSVVNSIPVENLEEPLSKEQRLNKEIQDHVLKHGDGIKDVAFRVKADVQVIFDKAIAAGAKSIQSPSIILDPLCGQIQLAAIGAYGDTTHSFINRELYKGVFLPGFHPFLDDDPITRFLPPLEFREIDHCVGNQSWNGVDLVVKFYEDCLGFHRIWTVDDKTMCTEYSAMRSTVVASPNEVVKMPINEPAVGLRKSQTEEYLLLALKSPIPTQFFSKLLIWNYKTCRFCDYYNGAGVQHIALSTTSIIATVGNLRQRGVEFLSVPDVYYTSLRKRLRNSGVVISEDIDKLQRLNILVDFDERGYLLQTFSKHVLDRPTVFIEVIQRKNFDGFGAGNFKALFEAMERDQALRGNL
ncbi:hypothetical protein FQN57_001314 [Myotisia sp. PD_48]|nr:hypothetical protein FQN57_001314 [Myotisia sp. PD_48]